MVNAVDENSDGFLLNAGLNDVATHIVSGVTTHAPIGGATSYSTTTASYFSGGSYSRDDFLQGNGFTYDGSGHLIGGTITSMQISQSLKIEGYGSETYTNLNLPVQSAIALGLTSDGAATVLSGNDDFTANAYSVHGYGGDDTFTIVGAGTLGNIAYDTTTNIDGGGGVNTAIFPNALRSAATVTGGGGNETVVQSGITANLVAIDKLQFIDGSTYEDNATPGARAALAFQGVFGRLPDAINAGGFGQLAEQSDAQTAARTMLATPEGQADTAGLGNGDFVARLYQTMLHRAPDATGAAGWQANLDSGQLDRGTVVAAFASSTEAQKVNFAPFASGAVFAADPNAVEVLRAYEVMLNRLPEASALAGNTAALDSGGLSLQQLYSGLQSSSEFLAHAVPVSGSDAVRLTAMYGNDPAQQINPYGITANTPYAGIRAVALSDQVTSLITPLVTSQGVTVHS